ncbi:MAG: ricin-type beta-trefoil lectin domain protein [Pseudomonadota bacterium]
MYEPSETDCGGLNQRVCKKSEQLRGCDPDLHRSKPIGGICTEDNKLIPNFIENKGEWSPPKWVQNLFKKKRKDGAIQILKDNKDNIDAMKEVVKNLQRNHGTLTNASSIRSLSAQDLIDAGASDVLESACGNNFLCTITLTAGADASYVVGGSGSGGIAFGTVHERGNSGAKDLKVTYILTTNVTGGASVGASGNVEIGFWKTRFNEMEGFAHGLQIGGSVSGVGVGGSVWWNINWFWENEDWDLFDWDTWFSDEAKDEYSGFVVGYQGGMELEVEYSWGYTWNWGESVEFLLKSRTKRCLQFENANRESSRAEMWGCHRGSNNQLWQHVDESLVNIKGLCLTAKELKKGSRLWAKECDGSDSQKWFQDGKAFKAGGLCLDVRRSEIGQDGGSVLLWTCHGGKNQQWRKDLR